MLCIMIAVVMLAGILAGCGTKTPAATPDQSAQPAVSSAVEATTAEPAAAEPVTIKFFSNLPDRNAGQGKLEQTILDNYQKENTNVKIELEMLQDEPYKQKFKAYSASNDLPDICNVWGQSSFLAPVIAGSQLAELNTADYAAYNFNKGSFDGFSADGKLYGLPRNQDISLLFYNKDVFAKNGVKVPTTFQELIEATKAFRAKGIAPCAINGKDKWAINILFEEIVLKSSGDQKLIYNALNRTTTFAKDPEIIKAADLFKQLMDAKFFQDSFTAADYGAARNLFGQEKTAMYFMGEWEMGMAADTSLSDNFRNNLAVMQFPAIDGGKGKVTDYVAWNGGGYAVSANSKVKDETIKLLNYMFKPDNWTKIGWQTGAVTPAQDFQSFFTGNETQAQKDIAKYLSLSTSMSGTTWNDSATPVFKTDIENLAQEFAVGMKTPQQFLEGADAAADKAAGK